jgi:periplasmic protein TonB
MLDQLVESKSHAGEDTRRSGFLLTTFIIMLTVLMSAWLYSLFAKDYGMGGDDLSLETLVAPPVIEDAPEPEPEKQPEKQKDPNVDVRKEIIASMTETPPKIPDKPSVEKLNIPPRDPNKYTVKGDINFSAANAPPPDYKGPVNTGGTGSDSGATGGGGEAETGGGPPPPPPPKKAVPKRHPLLRAAAVAAARGARFSPTKLSGQPVKVSGVITYNFVP